MQKANFKKQPTAAERYQAAKKALSKLSTRRRVQLIAEFHTCASDVPGILSGPLTEFEFEDLELPEEFEFELPLLEEIIDVTDVQLNGDEGLKL